MFLSVVMIITVVLAEVMTQAAPIRMHMGPYTNSTNHIDVPFHMNGTNITHSQTQTPFSIPGLQLAQTNSSNTSTNGTSIFTEEEKVRNKKANTVRIVVFSVLAIIVFAFIIGAGGRGGSGSCMC